MRWSQTVIDWADGDPTKGNIIVGSPLAVALVWRGTARFWLGRNGWRQDLDDATAMARSTDPLTHAMVVFWKHGWTITNWVLVADETVVHELEDALQIAEGLGDDSALGMVRYILGIALGLRDDVADHQRGLELLEQVRDMCFQGRFYTERIARKPRASPTRWRGPGAATPMVPYPGDAETHGLFLPTQDSLGTVLPAPPSWWKALLARGTEADVAEAEEGDRPGAASRAGG